MTLVIHISSGNLIKGNIVTNALYTSTMPQLAIPRVSKFEHIQECFYPSCTFALTVTKFIIKFLEIKI